MSWRDALLGVDVPLIPGCIVADAAGRPLTVVGAPEDSCMLEVVSVAAPHAIRMVEASTVTLHLGAHAGLGHAVRLLADARPGSEDVAEIAWRWLWRDYDEDLRMAAACALAQVFGDDP